MRYHPAMKRKAIGWVSVQALGFAVVLTATAACDDGDPVDGGDGGVTSDAAAGDGAAGMGGISPAVCTAAAPTALVANVNASSLAAVGDDFVYVEAGTGSAPGSIRRVASVGAAVTTLYTAATSHVIVEMMANATDLVFVDDNYAAVVTESRIMKMPVTGGAPVPLGAVLAEARLAGVDAANVYVVSKLGGKQRISRMALADGATTTVADVEGSTILGPLLMGSKLHYLQTVPMMTGAFAYQSLDVSGAAAMPMPFGVARSGTCLIGLQPMVFGATAVLCTSGAGGNRVVALDLDGTNPRPLIERSVAGPYYNVLASAGDTFYLQQLPTKAQALDGALWTMNLSNPAALSPVACGRGIVKNRLFRSIPRLDSAEIAVGSTRLGWIEQRLEGGNLTFTLFSQAH